VTSDDERAQAAMACEANAGMPRLLACLFLKLVRAHLAHAAPTGAIQEHPLVCKAAALLGAMVVHGATSRKPTAAMLLMGLRLKAGPWLSEPGLPACFQPETLQPPHDLVEQACHALVAPDLEAPVQQALRDQIFLVADLARDLARAVTDPWRAEDLGFDAETFRRWATSIENAVKPDRLPRRLAMAGNDATATYLALDFLPRAYRWKEQHSAMANGLAEAVRDTLAIARKEGLEVPKRLPSVNTLRGTPRRRD
jgi:hypothetical protein